MSELTELAAKLKTEGEKVAGFFADLDAEQWNTEVYTEGTIWTIRNILSHFVTSERGLVRLFEQIRQGGAGATEDFSIDYYNARQQNKTRDASPAELLEQYRSIRSDSIAWVLGLQEAELEIQGRHPFLQQTTLREMIKMLYIHNQIHYRDIRKVLK